jgi:deoxycytidylate deaminase
VLFEVLLFGVDKEVLSCSKSPSPNGFSPKWDPKIIKNGSYFMGKAMVMRGTPIFGSAHMLKGHVLTHVPAEANALIAAIQFQDISGFVPYTHQCCSTFCTVHHPSPDS